MKRKSIIAIIILLVAGLIILVGLHYNRAKPTAVLKPTDKTTLTPDESGHLTLSPPTQQEIADGQKTKDAKLNTDTVTPPKDTVTITSAQESSDKQVIIKTAIKGTGWQTCKLTLSNGAATISKQASVLFQPEYSTCTGFAISSDEFAVKGTWQINLSVSNNAGNLINTTGSVLINQ